MKGRLSKTEAAQLFGSEDRTVEFWMPPSTDPRGRAMSHFRIGTTVRFSLAGIEEWGAAFEVSRVLPRSYKGRHA
ncbi:MAG: hypothetical protein JWL59_4469 [Chthoniobacteraceae bacterium]|nr:hypothetical protein [Chthoniobacteraceae bacterium]